MLRDASDSLSAIDFRKEVQTWVDRLLGPEWQVVLGFDDTQEDRACIRAYLPNREATVMMNPAIRPREGRTAVHEITHIQLARIDQTVRHILDQLPEAVRPMAQASWIAALEETTEDVARTYRRAWREQDGQGG